MKTKQPIIKKNKEVILNRTKDYYKNNKEKLRKRAKNKYRENMGRKDIKIRLKKRNKN